MPSLRVIRALAQACHFLPTVAVTAVSAALAALAGLPVGRGALVVAAVFTGQLSIGWSNDYLDADRDRAVQRSDKPIVTGAVPRHTVGAAAAIALVSTSALSVALGWPGGAVALVTVLTAWTYNLRLKATAWSWLPYALAFGLAPAVVTLSAWPARWPAAWVLAAFALLGAAAHLANVLPDLSDDIAHGIRGLPHRMGARPTALITAGILLAASAVILFGPPGRLDPWRWAGFAAALFVAGAATRLAYRDPSSRRFFLAIILIAVIDLASFGLSGIRL